jgi:hypothetical protein
MRKWQVIPLLALIGTGIRADNESANFPHVAASRFGRCYAKSIPNGPWGPEGKTSVYWVDPKGDPLVHTFNWYSKEFYLECALASPKGPAPISVVRPGPWQSGSRAEKDHLAFEFYWDGALVASYSTLDLAGSPENVRSSASHYRVIERVIGYRVYGPTEVQFSVETVDGRTLDFDAKTGKQLKGE